MSGKVVIIGAGALSLGFLGERLAPDYELIFADKNIKAPLLKELQNHQRYVLNIGHLDGIESVTIKGQFNTFNIDKDSEKKDFYQALNEADLIFTTVGNQNLPSVISEIAPIINLQPRKNFILLGENGRNLSHTYQKFFEKSKVVDTVMSRMCRFANPEESSYEPLGKTLFDKLVVESYAYLPLDQKVCLSGQFSPAFTLVEPEIFATWEDIKFFAHNGTHAFVAYQAFLDGIRYFSDVDHKLKEKAADMMFNEIIPALHRAHPKFPYQDLNDYAENLLKRIFSPYFHDSVERGIRGVLEKMKPNERLVSGLKFIYQQDVKPVQYASTIRAGYKIASMQKHVSNSIGDFLINHCGIIEEELIQLVLSELEL